jgi:hypothetical protein
MGADGGSGGAHPHRSPPDTSLLHLLQAGFDTAAEVLELGVVELAREIDVSNDDALALLDVIRAAVASASTNGSADNSGVGTDTRAAATSAAASASSGGGNGGGGAVSSMDGPTRTAYDVLTEERGRRSIVTMCPDWDTMLGGGVPLTKITEFCKCITLRHHMHVSMPSSARVCFILSTCVRVVTMCTSRTDTASWHTVVAMVRQPAVATFASRADTVFAIGVRSTRLHT